MGDNNIFIKEDRPEISPAKKLYRDIWCGLKGRNAVICINTEGFGGACNDYIIRTDGKSGPIDDLCRIRFQEGPSDMAGAFGVFVEDLIAVCIDRLQSYQAGTFECRENEMAIAKLEEAKLWLDRRTIDRTYRNVEGTSNP